MPKKFKIVNPSPNHIRTIQKSITLNNPILPKTKVIKQDTIGIGKEHY